MDFPRGIVVLSCFFLFHLLGVLVVFAVLSLLVRNDWAARVGTLLFAVHPVQVEPVVWAAGLRDVVSGFFSPVAVWINPAYSFSVLRDNRGLHQPSGTASTRPSATFVKGSEGVAIETGKGTTREIARSPSPVLLLIIEVL